MGIVIPSSGEPARVQPPPPASTTFDAPLADLGALLAAYERSLILAALGAAGGRQRSAARLLRVLPSTLHEKMRRLGIRAQRAHGGKADDGARLSACLSWSGVVAPGGTVELRGLNGPVRIEAAATGEVEIVVTRTGPRALFSAVEVRIVEHCQGVVACAVCQPLEAAASRRAVRRVSRAAATVRVDLVARVPPGLRVVASTVNDDIEVVGLTKGVEATTANGRVRFLPAVADGARRH